MKLSYYAAFCIIVVNIGSMLMDLIFDDEINLLKVEANIGFALFGFVSMLYVRYVRATDELGMNTYCLLLAIDSECGADGSRKIQEKARAFKFLGTIDPEKFCKELIEKRNKGGKK